MALQGEFRLPRACLISYNTKLRMGIFALQSTQHVSLALGYPNPHTGIVVCRSRIYHPVKDSHLEPSASCPRPMVRGAVKVLALEEGFGRSLPSRYRGGMREIWSVLSIL